MPDVRLSEDYKKVGKAGEIVSLSDEDYSAALDARVVAKVFPEPVTDVAGKPLAKKSSAGKAE